MEVSPGSSGGPPALSSIDERRMQLLESRFSLGPRGVSAPGETSEPLAEASGKEVAVPPVATPKSRPLGSDPATVIYLGSNSDETASESSETGREKENRKRPLEVFEVDDRSNSRASHAEDNQTDTNSRGPSAANKNTIDKYFPSFSSGQGSGGAVLSLPSVVLSNNTSPPAQRQSLGKEHTRGGKDSTLTEMKREIEALKYAKELADSKVARLEDEVSKAGEIKERNLQLSKCLEDVYRSNARAEMRRRRDRLAHDCVRLGKFRAVQVGPTGSIDSWEDGYAFKEIMQRSGELLQKKEELDRRKKRLASQRRLAKREEGDPDLDYDLAVEAEAIRTHLEQLKKEELNLAEERRLLDAEKEVHKKELRRSDCEDHSRFVKDLPCLNGRYILTCILGRGGFSEVWRAFDLVDRIDVAIKIHQLNPNWPEDRKLSYIKHVTREYRIHRGVDHPRIVHLYDVFEIDVNSFATVMELCR